jgi:hypothetical protein
MRILSIVVLAGMVLGSSAELADAKGRRGGGGNPCKADAQRLCPGIKDRRAMAQCMVRRWSEVSQACKDKINKRRGKR